MRGGAYTRRVRTSLAIVVLLSLCLPAASQAQSPPFAGDGVRATGDYLAKMDADHDGRVSLDEYQAWMSYAFDAMDRDGNAVLSVEELPGNRGKPISRAEHLTRLAQRFRKQDANKDGHLSAKELAAPPQ